MCYGEHFNGGYEVELVEKVHGNVTCPLCKRLMRDPIQTSRGELACEKCYREAARDRQKCPIDNGPVELDEIFQDKFKCREIQNLICYCMNKGYGCTWKGKISAVETHLENCRQNPLKCKSCEITVSREDMVYHLYNCDDFILKGKCMYKGCPFIPKDVEGLKAHLHEDVLLHTILHTTLLDNLKNEVNSQQQYHQESMKELETAYREEINSLKDQLHVFMETTKTLQVKNDETMRKMVEKVKELEQGSQKSDKISNKPQHERDSSQIIDNLQNSIAVLSHNMSDLNIRQQILENTTYDGKIFWKIDQVSMRLNQAASGKVTALHSAPAYTERYGYKFCGRIYLDGDGCGKVSHVSLFFVLMKSPHDSLLAWPFRKTVTMNLINQSDRSKDFTQSFRANFESSSFMRPTKEMNSASGIPSFITKDEFFNNGFIMDDSIIIEIIISS